MLLFKNLFSAKYGLIKQYDQVDRGPASLHSVLKFYGGNSSLVHLRELTNTSVNGSTMLDVVNAARRLALMHSALPVDMMI